MRNILLVTADPIDQCSFYRLIGPYSQLRTDPRQPHPHFDVVAARNSDPDLGSKIWLADIVVMGRPFTELDIQLARFTRQLGKRLVLDFDDDFLQMSDTQMLYDRFASYPQRKILEELGALADCITVSTPEIAKSWDEFSPALVVVVPNALDESVFRLAQEANVASKVVVWRGSFTHFKDLDMLESRIDEDLCQLVFMGTVHHALPARFPKAKFIPFMGMHDYMKTLKRLKPKAVVVPLEDTGFNRAKSNCAWIEAAVAGAVTIASDLPEWRQPGIFRYDGRETIERVLGMNTQSAFEATCEHIPRLEYVNARRRNLLQELLDH